MKLLFLLGHRLVIGGHFKTTQAWVAALTQQGHETVVLGHDAADALIAPFRSAGAAYVTLESCVPDGMLDGSLRSRARLAGALADVGGRLKPDVLHVQDQPMLVPGYWAACRMGVACLYVQAGGEHRNDNPPPKCRLVVCSEEQIDGYAGEGVPATLVQARIDRKRYCPGEASERARSLLRPAAGGLSCFMAIRLSPEKRPWLETMLRLAGDPHLPAGSCLVIAGDGPLRREFEERAADTGGTPERRGCVRFIGPVYDDGELGDLYRAADVVLGNGRGIMEALSCGRAAVVLGEDGESEMVYDRTAYEIAYCNFSGRHFRKETAKNARPTWLDALTDGDRRREIWTWSAAYAAQHLDADIGARRLLAMYATLRAPKRTDFWRWILARRFRRLWCQRMPPGGRS
jgi:hypothetical protein